MMEKESYSHSKLDVARGCMKAFKYQYIDRLKGISDTSATDFGEVCHYIAEHYKGGGKEELLHLYHSVVPSKWILKPEYKKRVVVALKNIHEHWKHALYNIDPEKVHTEGEVVVDLNSEISLNGKIDLFIQNGDKIIVKDYKTNKSSEGKSHRNQLAMYMLMLHLKFKIPFDVIDTEIVYLALEEFDKKGNPVLNEGIEHIIAKESVDESDVECLKTEILTIHAQIQKNKATGKWKPKPSWKCKWCKFNNICEDKQI